MRSHAECSAARIIVLTKMWRKYEKSIVAQMKRERLKAATEVSGLDKSKPMYEKMVADTNRNINRLFIPVGKEKRRVALKSLLRDMRRKHAEQAWNDYQEELQSKQGMRTLSATDARAILAGTFDVYDEFAEFKERRVFWPMFPMLTASGNLCAVKVRALVKEVLERSVQKQENDITASAMRHIRV
jgi:hypothetical protein